ncbi:MAG: type II toxin-antitoxin system prevent-host-death family antitoxin [Acidobacteriaceae bacterium]
MDTVNMHEAKTHLSRLVAKAARGEGFIIARAGKPMVKVVPVDAPEVRPRRRTGFLAGQITFPQDRAEFKAIGADEIAAMFEGSE